MKVTSQKTFISGKHNYESIRAGTWKLLGRLQRKCVDNLSIVCKIGGNDTVRVFGTWK